MSGDWVLLGNDDGADAPALVPFAAALEARLDREVRIVVPTDERSWSGKAVSRFGSFASREVLRGGRSVHAVDGTPADAIQLGVHALFDDGPPALTVTGINLGFNAGLGFLSSSGTVWAAAEAALAGIPAMAVSTGARGDHQAWREIAEAATTTAAADWHRVSQVAADVVAVVAAVALDDHADLVSVNMPWSTDADTPRRVTGLAPTGYGPLFVRDADGAWTFTRGLEIDLGTVEHHHDIAALDRDEIAITPVRLPRAAELPDHLRDALTDRSHP